MATQGRLTFFRGGLYRGLRQLPPGRGVELGACSKRNCNGGQKKDTLRKEEEKRQGTAEGEFCVFGQVGVWSTIVARIFVSLVSSDSAVLDPQHRLLSFASFQFV